MANTFKFTDLEALAKNNYIVIIIDVVKKINHNQL